MADSRRHVIAAGAFATAAAFCVLSGVSLPGGRWVAVHLFVLGALTNLLVGLMPFFARTVLHAPLEDGQAPLRFALLNGGVVVLLVGLTSGSSPAVAAGATMLSAAVLLLWRALRQARRRALPSRFGFVGRTYERACGAFLHAALLGAAMGLGLVPGTWYGGVRLAHLHVALLGWVGLPLLATLVTFGPTLLRTRMAPDAAPRAAAALPWAATGLTVAVVALALTGAPAPLGRGFELLAAGGLAVYAWGVASVCLPVLSVWRSRVRSLAADLIASSCAWFLVAALLDVVLVVAGRTALLDVVAPALIIGVLAQAVLGSLLHLLPVAMATSREGRAALRGRLTALPEGAAVAFNTAVILLTAALLASTMWDVVPRGAVALAWAVIAGGVLLLGGAMAWACVREAVVR